jgi:hypothetical protein
LADIAFSALLGGRSGLVGMVSDDISISCAGVGFAEGQGRQTRRLEDLRHEPAALLGAGGGTGRADCRVAQMIIAEEDAIPPHLPHA